MKVFQMHRHVDATGVSGIGIVAEGVEFNDGTTIIRWLGDIPSTVVWTDIQAAIKIHGHDGGTEFKVIYDSDRTVPVGDYSLKPVIYPDCPDVTKCHA